MVTDNEGYVHLIEYLTEHLSLFENTISSDDTAESVLEVIELTLSEQIIAVCNQNEGLTLNQRNGIIREVDAIVYDLEEVLSRVVNNPITEQQRSFINEFSVLIKNLFDSEINRLLQQSNSNSS